MKVRRAAECAPYLDGMSRFRAGRGKCRLRSAALGALLLLTPVVHAATISGINPDHGPAGTEVNVTGSSLQTTAIVYFGSTEATAQILSVSAASVRVRVPPNAFSGPIHIVTTGSGAVSSAWYFIAAPRVESFTPLSGVPGTLVDVNGPNFDPHLPDGRGRVTEVRFNGTPAAFKIVGESLLYTLVPTNATSGSITLVNEAGSYSTLIPFQVPALIAGFSPPQGMPGDAVQIRGSNLASAQRVAFGFTEARFAVVSPTNLVAWVPTNAINGPLQITTPAGATTTSSNFVVTPRIFAFTPAAGDVGTNVTLMGGGFDGLTEVTFNGVKASSVTLLSSVQARAVVPSGASTGPIRIATSSGSFETAELFYMPARIASFTPAAGSRDTVVTIDGQNLNGATAVLFNGAAAAFTVVSPSRLTATVPALATTGRLSIRTPAGDVFSSATFTMRPLLDGFAPDHGPVGSAVLLGGAGLTNLAWVRIGSRDTTFTVIDSTRVRAIVPVGAYSGAIRVRNTAGVEAQAPGIFFVDGAKPELTSFSPTNGTVGTRVRLVGAGLASASKVQFGTVDAAFGVLSGTEIEAAVPSGAGTAPIAVTTLDGIAFTPAVFVVTKPLIRMTIETTGDLLTLRWRSVAADWVLESTTTLGPDAVWSPVGVTPEDEGVFASVTLPLPRTGTALYRLREPVP